MPVTGASLERAVAEITGDGLEAAVKDATDEFRLADPMPLRLGM